MKKDANQTEHLLKKKQKDLTPAELRSLEKDLGIKEDPFPMWGTMRVDDGRGGTVLEQVLSLIASDDMPLTVYSERPEEDVVAIAVCDMPVPSMLPYFFVGLQRRAPDSKMRGQTFFGDPGYGKSFLGAMQGRLRSGDSVEVLDCGGKNMRELLFEMVLDFGSGDALPDAIDKRAASGMLKPLSLGLLEGLNSLEATPPEYANEPKKMKEWKEKTTIVTFGADGRPSIDWESLRTGGAEKINNAFDILSKISKVEGLDNAGGNALGINSQYGPLIRAWMNGDEIVLDEYNKSRENTDDNLQSVLQFIMGGSDYARVENPLKNKDASSGPAYFDFKREDQKLGFFATFTGNRRIDGTTTRELSKSAYSRLLPDTLPDPSLIDWQHRLCQMMTGVPISTLYHAYKGHGDAVDPDQHPEKFGKWLMDQRRRKAEIDGVPMSDLQYTLLSNWKQVLNATEKLAKFYAGWAEMTDVDKILSNGNADLLDEVDKEYSDKEAIDFRKIIYHLEASMPIRPQMIPQDETLSQAFGRRSKNRKKPEKVEESVALNFGTRLVEMLEQLIAEKTKLVGKNKLFTRLERLMQSCGLRDIKLLEGAHSQQRSVEEDLNVSSFTDKNMERRAEMARKTFASYLRQVDPQVTADDEDIVTVKRVLDALRVIEAKDTGASKEIFFVNRDHETLSARPFVAATVRDMAAYKAEGKTGVDFTLDDLVSHDDFLASLAIPTVGAKNLAAIWESNAGVLVNGRAAAEEAAQDDEALNIAQNLSRHGLAATSLQVLYQDKDVDRPAIVDIIHSGQRGKTLIISEKVPTKLLPAFKEAGIIHIDRNDPNAKEKIEAALKELTRNIPDSAKNSLTEAFKYRNEVSETAAAGDLSDMLLDKDKKNVFPKFIVKNNSQKLG